MQWAAPDLNSEPQIAVGSAGPHPGALERTGQRRTSPGDLPSGVGSPGPQLPENMKICQKMCQKKMSEDMSKEMSEDMSKNMSKEMSEDMSKEMSDNMSETKTRKNVR